MEGRPVRHPTVSKVRIPTHPASVHVPGYIAGRQGSAHGTLGSQVLTHVENLLVDLQFGVRLGQVYDPHRGRLHDGVEEGCVLRHLALEDAVQVPRDTTQGDLILIRVLGLQLFGKCYYDHRVTWGRGRWCCCQGDSGSGGAGGYVIGLRTSIVMPVTENTRSGGDSLGR